MELWEIAHIVSNLMIIVGGSFFIISVFGRKSPTIEALPNIERWTIKGALSITAAGSLFNLMLMQPTPWSEIALNFGLGGIFIWGAFFHFKYFVWKDENK